MTKLMASFIKRLDNTFVYLHFLLWLDLFISFEFTKRLISDKHLNCFLQITRLIAYDTKYLTMDQVKLLGDRL